jgi:hypothetical protein
VQACRALHDAGRNDMVWYAKAMEKRYPQNTLKLSPASPYPDFRSLVLDDNRENASLLLAYDNLPFGGFSSEYKMNRPDYFFECCITGLQYNRMNATTATDNLQIFFDCRGEADLRDPLSSSIAFVIHRPRPCRRELREELAHLNAQRRKLRDLVESLEPVYKHPEDTPARHVSALRALNITSHRLYTLNRELQDSSHIAFSDLVTVVRPSTAKGEYHFEVKKAGHYKGWIQFNNISQIDELLAATSVASEGGGGGNRGGLDLVFTYANPVPVLPQMNQVDYHPVTLLTLPPATSFTESMMKEGKYSSRDDFSEKFLMQEMSVEEERKRWSHVEREMEIGGRGGRRTAMPGGGSGSGGDRFTSWFV